MTQSDNRIALAALSCHIRRGYRVWWPLVTTNHFAQALWFEAPRVAALRPEPIYPPAAREVQVRALTSLVSAGSELNLYRGEGNLPDLLLPTARGTLPFPIKFAYQTVGEIVAVGEQAGFNVGEKVFATHPHQDIFNILSGDLVTRLPDGADLTRAQFAGMFNVSLTILLRRPVRPGEVIAVSGLGLIGSFVAYLARLAAGRLIIIDPLSSRRERAAWIGADYCVHPSEAREAIDAATEGRGVDMFVETSGAPAALQTAILNTAVLGTIAVAAWYGTRPVQLSLSPEFHLRSQKMLSMHVFHLDESQRWPHSRRLTVSLDYLRRIDVAPLISHRIPFREAPRAYKLLDECPEQTLAVLLEH
jgi:threonine dehydrogenase-like Zn-dependent dehydrogenase